MIIFSNIYINVCMNYVVKIKKIDLIIFKKYVFELAFIKWNKLNDILRYCKMIFCLYCKLAMLKRITFDLVNMIL